MAAAGDHRFLPGGAAGCPERGMGKPAAAAAYRDHSLLSLNPPLPKDAADVLQLMKASLSFHQDSCILEITMPVLPTRLPAGFACRLPPPPALPLLALLLARAWFSSRAARIQPEEALSWPGRRFRAHFGAEWQQCAFAHAIGLPSAVATSVPVTAGLGLCWCWMLCAGKHIVAVAPSCHPADAPSQTYSSIFCRKDVNKG